MWNFLDLTPKIAPQSRFYEKWLNSMKNENPCFENFSGVTTFDLALREDEELA
jgi:hypothetical protein